MFFSRLYCPLCQALLMPSDESPDESMKDFEIWRCGCGMEAGVKRDRYGMREIFCVSTETMTRRKPAKRKP